MSAADGLDIFFPSAGAPTDDGLDQFFSSAPRKEVPPPRSESSIVAGGLKNAGKAVLKGGAELVDFLNPIPMAAHLVGYLASRKLGGEAPQVSKEAADAIAESMSNGYSKLIDELGLAPEEGQTAVGTTTEKIGGALSRYAKRVGDTYELHSGGRLKSEDVQEGINALFLGAMTKMSGAAMKPRLAKPGEVGTPPSPETPAARARADVEAEAGITPRSPQTAGEFREARRAQARAAFAEDPLYADYLRNRAEEAAQRRAAEPGISTDPTGLSEIFPDEAAPVAGALATGVGKLQAGRPFDLSPEETGALRGARNSGRNDIFGAAAALGLGTAAALYGAADEDSGGPAMAAAGALGLVALRRMPEATPLGAMLEKGDYTLKTLDRLPQNRFEFTREQVLQQLNRADVGKAEKDLVLSTLGDKEKISARDLLVGVKERSGDFELKPKETDDFADYGLDAIGRQTPDDWSPETGQTYQTPPARTTVYQSPLELGDVNHFSDPNYFGHTRSFDEGGVRHVIEVQSDVAQHYKPLAPEKRAALEAELREARILNPRLEYLNSYPRGFFEGAEHLVETANSSLLDELGLAMRHPYKDLAPREIPSRLLEDARAGNEKALDAFYEGLKKVTREHSLREMEVNVVLSASSEQGIAPIVRDWPKRLVREEMAQAARVNPDAPVRFATADTVAKVEGWRREGLINRARRAPLDEGEQPGFIPKHQSIYDRYKRDIEKFLTKDLGGKPYTDPQGHTWIEVPPFKRSTTGRPGGPTQMFGRADPRMLARLAAVGLGAWAGTKLDPENKLGAGILGGLLGAVGASIPPGKAIAKLRELAAPDKRVSIAGLADAHETATRLAAMDVVNLQKQVEAKVPKAADREKITAALSANSPAGLTPDQRSAYAIAHQYLSGLNRVARSVGISNAAASLQQRLLAGLSGAASADIGVIMGERTNSLVRSIENQKLVRALKATAGPTGTPLIVPTSKAPFAYQSFSNPILHGFKVHPDIVPQLKFILDTDSPGAAMTALRAINDTSKRAAVSFSLFHAKALADALIGGSNKWLFAVKDIPSFVSGEHAFLKEMEKGSASPLIHDAVESGLVFGPEKAALTVEDTGQSFYAAMSALQRVADKTIPGGGKAVEGVVAANHYLDKLMWARLHAGMKLSIWAEKRDALLLNSAKAHAKDPNARVLSPQEAGRIASSFTNDLFGGLNWRRIAMDAGSRYERVLAENTLNPSSRRVLQLLFFAPDWTLSTTRAVVKAIDKDLLNPIRTARGLIRPTSLGDLHRQYVLRSALYYLAVGDALNYALSGHHLWENKDWTFIDMGDGRRMQWSKHAMEPVHWLTKPIQQLINKLGLFPREIANQLAGTEYLAPRKDKQGNISAGPPMRESRLAHLAKNFEPIALQQGLGGGEGADSFSALAGFAGAPIYGMTEAQKNRAAEERRRKRLLNQLGR